MKGPRFHSKFTAIFLSAVCLSGGFGLSNTERGPGGAPSPFSVERYTCLWKASCFPKPVRPKPAPAKIKEKPKKCVYQLTGIASLNDKQYVYLREKSGTIHELTTGVTHGDLEVINIVKGKQTSDHRVMISTPQGKYELKFDPATASKPKAEAPTSPEPKKVAARSRPVISRKAKQKVAGWIDNPWLHGDGEK
ncbi:MAG: hypothetical protein P1V20_03300 [Verrucomicrobiales bacterium]|nr:hypothetical protein [Verrucomicrobiales bacterium]